ncbi:unnamed protein product [Dicrocoelium dendriticum]|nr:unnamed protein product [Dicrocoelium dendriticum]
MPSRAALRDLNCCGRNFCPVNSANCEATFHSKKTTMHFVRWRKIRRTAPELTDNLVYIVGTHLDSIGERPVHIEHAILPPIAYAMKKMTGWPALKQPTKRGPQRKIVPADSTVPAGTVILQPIQSTVPSVVKREQVSDAQLLRRSVVTTVPVEAGVQLPSVTDKPLVSQEPYLPGEYTQPGTRELSTKLQKFLYRRFIQPALIPISNFTPI